MPVEISWQTIAAIIGLFAGVVAVLEVGFLWAVKWLLQRNHAQLRSELDVRFQMVEKQISTIDSRGLATERDLLQLRAELPERYVQRDDWIRMSNIIDAKLDALRELFYRIFNERKGGHDDGG